MIRSAFNKGCAAALVNFKVGESIPEATRWLQDMREHAKKNNYSLFAIAEDPEHPHGGTSITYVHPGHSGDAIRRARKSHVEWELANNHDPDHDWDAVKTDQKK